MENRKYVERVFESMMDDTAGEPLPAAILTLAVVITAGIDCMDTKIAMGLRTGLFGANADPEASIDVVASKVGDALELLADVVGQIGRDEFL